jgi:hypothetical protein
VNWYQKLGIAAGFGECQKVGDMWGLPKLFLQRDYAYVAPSNDRRHSNIEWTLNRLVICTAPRIRFVYWLNSNKGTKTLTGFFATCRKAQLRPKSSSVRVEARFGLPMTRANHIQPKTSVKAFR